MATQYASTDPDFVTYANAAALTAVATAEEYEGLRAGVTGLGVFKLEKLSEAATDDVTVIAAADGGNWVKADVAAYLMTNASNHIDGSQMSNVASISLSAGTAALPSLSFEGNANTGIYQSATNKVSITTNGANRFDFTDSENVSAVSLRIVAGSVGTPGISFATEQTGMYLASASKIGFSAGGLPVFDAATDAFNLAAGSEYRIGTTKVVGQRETGWTLMTGTAQRGTFATGTVTLPELAGVVLALQEDLGLNGHGLIDA